MVHLACALLLLLLTYQVVLATVAPSLLSGEVPSICVDGCSRRSLFNILWDCVSTTIICAWTALHPNIPPQEGTLKRILRRGELMTWTILAPEILPCWALNQLLAARNVRDVYNESKGYKKSCGIWKTWKQWISDGIWETIKRSVSMDEIPNCVKREWTLQHGHFLIMGGFHLVEPPDEGCSTSPNAKENAATDKQVTSNSVEFTSTLVVDEDAERSSVEDGPKLAEGRVTLLTPEMLKKLLKKHPEFKIHVTEDEILDKSKGDAMSKFIFVMQSSWFILHCIARHVQGLGLTQIELTTLALASLNGITLLLWWHKPLGSQTPIRVYVKRKLTDAEKKATRCRRWRKSGWSTLILEIQESFKGRLTIIWDVVLRRREGNRFVALLIQLPLLILVLLFLPIILSAIALTYRLHDLLVTTSFPNNATHVPTFYAPAHEYRLFGFEFHFVFFLILGPILGSIHCAGWNLPFPTYAEQKLWRGASLATTIIPLIGIVILGVLTFVGRVFRSSPNSGDVNVTEIILSIIAPFMYAAARLVLLAQALALLRNPPPSAFIAVDWTKFYPRFL